MQFSSSLSHWSFFSNLALLTSIVNGRPGYTSSSVSTYLPSFHSWTTQDSNTLPAGTAGACNAEATDWSAYNIVSSLHKRFPFSSTYTKLTPLAHNNILLHFA